MFISVILLALTAISSIIMMKNVGEISKKSFLYVIVFNIFILFYVIVTNGFRWQFSVLFVIVFVLYVMVIFSRLKIISLNKVGRIITISLTGFITVITLILAYGFPVYSMPSISGDFLVGTQTFEITDENRLEIYTDEPNDVRKIKIQMWYPAQTIQGYQPSMWLDDGLDIPRALTKDWGLPSFILDQTIEVRSNSFIDAPLNDALDDYPVVIISHGWSGFRNLHSDLAEEYASQGYIAVAIDHTYGSLATVFELDVAYLNKAALPQREETPDFLDYANTLVNVYGDDTISTINYLEHMNQDETHEFFGRLDLSSIVAIGHSTGGGGIVSAALKDDRIKGIIGLDAWVESIELNRLLEGLNIPALFLRSGAWEISFNNERLYQLVEASAESYLYQVNGTTHYDFAMVYMYSPFTGILGITGDVDGERVNQLLEGISLDFINDISRQVLYEPSMETYEELEEVNIEG